MIVDFTEQEASVTLQLIDMAVKAGGINVAEAGLVITKKIQASFKKEEPIDEPTK